MTHILLSTMLMSISRLHLGQNKGKFKRVVSFRTLILVRQWHIGHRIHSDFRLVIDAKSHQLLATTNTPFFSIFIDSRTYLPQYPKCIFVYYSAISVLCACGNGPILLRLTPNVDKLCNVAEVAGGKIPITPSAISTPLNPITKR